MAKVLTNDPELLAHFDERYQNYTREQIEGIADLLFQEAEIVYSSGMALNRIHLAVTAEREFKMRGEDVRDCIKIMERKYADKLRGMNYS
jgi:hypothetical protein